MCDKNITIGEDSNYSCWEKKSTTRDEREIIDYLKENRHIIKDKKILHVGIGNTEFGKIFSKDVTFIDGLTISVPEKRLGLKNKCYRNIHICNKYNMNDMNNFILDNKYDIILDQGIKCYTCCYEHFLDLISFYKNHLEDDGKIIISKHGMSWSGFDLKTAINMSSVNRICYKTNRNKSNQFLDSELNDLSKKYNFKINKIVSIVILNF